MKIERVWAMPSKWTFTIKPIAKLLRREMAGGGTWLDPMAGMNSPAHITNDINPDAPTTHHMDTLTFLKQQPTESIDGIIFDPPYSAKMSTIHYNITTHNYTQLINQCRNHLARILRPNGKAVSFGWNTQGLGVNPLRPKRRRRKPGSRARNTGSTPTFPIYYILIVEHGVQRPPTLVTCQRKVQTSL